MMCLPVKYQIDSHQSSCRYWYGYIYSSSSSGNRFCRTGRFSFLFFVFQVSRSPLRVPDYMELSENQTHSPTTEFLHSSGNARLNCCAAVSSCCCTCTMLSGTCRRVLRSSTFVRYSRREGIHGPLGAVSRTQRLLSSSVSPADGAALAVEPEHLRNIAIIAHVGTESAGCSLQAGQLRHVW